MVTTKISLVNLQGGYLGLRWNSLSLGTFAYCSVSDVNLLEGKPRERSVTCWRSHPSEHNKQYRNLSNVKSSD